MAKYDVTFNCGISYKYFMQKNKLKDNKDSYQKYLKETDHIYSMMNPDMQEQYAEVNYPLRFTEHTA